MKSIIIVTLALVAIAVAAPAEEPVKILRFESNQEVDGGYNFAFEAENGINRVETGEVKEVLDEEQKPHKVVIVRGSYSYPNAEGKPETVNYFADETGYHADGESIPKAPVARR